MLMEAIAWLDGEWGHPDQIGVPISDRGLRLAEGVFETILINNGVAMLLEPHLQRWHQGAKYLGLPTPPAIAEIKTLTNQAILRSGISNGALRLNWSRGSGGGRGLALAEIEGPGRCWGSLHHYKPNFQLQSTWVSQKVKRWAESGLSHYKTFAYVEMALAKQEAQNAGHQEALLLSSAGGLCCASSANLLVWRAGIWHTPALSSGCLPGVMRAQAVQQGIAIESNFGDRLLTGEPAVLLNSLDCRPITKGAIPIAESLFWLLLNKSKISN